MRSLNPRKPIRMLNRTKHFRPGVSKTHIQFSSPDTYQARRIKIEGYESRLYWQYRYCEDHSGQTYFYTLTYNDAHLPKYMGHNCFDYEDLRDLLTGGFRKQLLRKFGMTFKYFVGAELGDGKGSRGLHNNPHYHVLFFLEPANNPRYPFVPILPDQFRHLIRMYWQGFDQEYGRVDFRDAKYGIAKEGEPDGLTETVTLGRVINFRACMYCSKYVTKDAKLRMAEDDIRRKYRLRFRKSVENEYELYERFFNEFLCSKYCVNTDEELLKKVMPSSYVPERYPDWLDESLVLDDLVKDVIRYNNLWKEFRDFKRIYIEDKVRERINEYRNRYCNKCRISQGVGDYALDFVDLENPSVQVPSSDGFKNRPLCLYYYRKLYTKIEEDYIGNKCRVLNDLGIEHKCSQLDKQICKKMDSACSLLDSLVGTRTLYEKMYESDVNTSVFLTYDDFLRNLNYLLSVNNIQQILRRYAEYKIIYEDRWYKVEVHGLARPRIHPHLDPVEDYRRFIVPTTDSCLSRFSRPSVFLESHSEDWHPYSEHPYFLRYIGLFNVLDCCADYFLACLLYIHFLALFHGN